jgi:hypothetical protein
MRRDLQDRYAGGFTPLLNKRIAAQAPQRGPSRTSLASSA